MNQRKFTIEDQEAFAELSGDYNPLHVDPLAARRYMFGQPVVHGVHAILWALDNCLIDYPNALKVQSMRAKFSRPIPLGEQVHCSVRSDGLDHLEIELTCGGSLSSQIYIHKKTADANNAAFSPSECFEKASPERQHPRDMSEDEIVADSGALELCLDVERVAKLFPHLSRTLPPLQIAIMLATTRLVGMRCPGLFSIFSELYLITTESHGNSQMSYEVTRFDRRFGLVLLNVTAPGMAGSIKAFIRPIPQQQASFPNLKKQVDAKEFVGQRALIIGGSRGLGEVATKLLTAGGASARITFQQGSADAQRIVDEVASNGGDADCFHFDVLNPNESHAFSPGEWLPTHLYYFATPFIFSGVKGMFAGERFRKFCDYYVTGFMDTLKHFDRAGLRHIFYPSSVAIDELPLDLGEYASAKAASEVLCAFLEKSAMQYNIYRPRLPRMATDQTVSLLPVINQDPAPMLIKHLRGFRDASLTG